MRFADPRIQGTFDGLCQLWQDVRYVETKLPPEVAARRIAKMGRAQVAEGVAVEQWRAREAFAKP